MFMQVQKHVANAHFRITFSVRYTSAVLLMLKICVVLENKQRIIVSLPSFLLHSIMKSMVQIMTYFLFK